jgi:glycosyltransferase involved in cell wall biosynthesis
MKASPTVSIILPTYNRSKFLREAIDAIRGQTLTDWELIVIDDGSTDDTGALIQQLTADCPQSVRYIYQQNQGPYGARNKGLDLATGKHIAFYDSDDLWRPYHLKDCVDGLEENPDVDWTYGACRIENLATGEELEPSTFYIEGEPRPFLKLKTRVRGVLSIIEDDSVIECMITHGLFCGLQNSVLRSSVFKETRFEAASRNEAEDQLFVISTLRRGCRLAFIDKVHVDYRIHESNSSAAGSSLSDDKMERVLRMLVTGYERILAEPNWSKLERRAILRRLNSECFWKLGYSTLWMQGRHKEALKMFRRGLRHWPWDWRCWKTYLTKQFFART